MSGNSDTDSNSLVAFALAQTVFGKGTIANREA